MEQRLNEHVGSGHRIGAAEPEDLNGLSISEDHTALLFDFDGTLVDIAPTPDAIKVGHRDKALLEGLVKRHHGAVSIISGRNLREIEHYLDGFEGTISGGHGAELRHDGKMLAGIDCDHERLEQIKAALMEFVIIDPRVLAEDKSHGMVLHFRQHPYLEDEVRSFLDRTVGDDPEFEILPAKMAFEIKPKGISKATAIERILSFREFDGLNVLYAGDDVTDEAGFALINDLGGITIKVGDGPTQAQYRTGSPSSFKKWLWAQSGSFERRT